MVKVFSGSETVGTKCNGTIENGNVKDNIENYCRKSN